MSGSAECSVAQRRVVYRTLSAIYRPAGAAGGFCAYRRGLPERGRAGQRSVRRHHAGARQTHASLFRQRADSAVGADGILRHLWLLSVVDGDRLARRGISACDGRDSQLLLRQPRYAADLNEAVYSWGDRGDLYQRDLCRAAAAAGNLVRGADPLPGSGFAAARADDCATGQQHDRSERGDSDPRLYRARASSETRSGAAGE